MIPYTTIPLISAFFLIFVGVLIGHFVWYRYRDEQAHRSTAMRRKIDDLNSSLDIQTNEYTLANTRLAELESLLLTAQEENRQLTSKLRQQETLHESTIAALKSSDLLNVELRDELSFAKEKRIELEAQFQEAQESLSVVETDRNATTNRINELTSEMERRSQLAEKNQNDLGNLRDENICLRQTNEDQAEELKQLNSKCQGKFSSNQEYVTLRADYQRMSVLLSEARAASQVDQQQFESECEKLLAELASEKTENKVLQRVNAEYVSQLESQMVLANELSGKVSAALTDLMHFEQKASQADVLREERDRLVGELSLSQSEISRMSEELDLARIADEQARVKLGSLRDRTEKLEQELEVLTSCQQESDAKLSEQNRRRESLERALAGTSEELAQLQVERERLEGVEDEIVELDARLRQGLADLKLARTEREEALTAESSTRDIVVTLRDELRDRLESLQALEEEKDSALSTLEEETINHQRVCEELQLRTTECTRLEHEVEMLKQRDDDRDDRMTQVSQDLEQLQARYEQAVAEVGLYKQRFHDLESSNNAARESRKGGSLFGQASPAKMTFSFRQVRRKEDVVRAEDRTKVRHDNRLGTVFTERPFRFDDLTQIGGISEALSQELNALGVFTYKQMMEWDAAVMAEFARRLGCDRIVEQDWAGQARRLYHLQSRAAA
ncbi:MAG: hypothetical protein GY768_11545 [Planctomycetaceae bacterium]|nr:hypothetical protein [Planctomycetaceae bacterium]